MLAAFNVLEWSFTTVLVIFSAAIGAFSVVVVARMIEPRGVRALLRRLAGKP